MCEIFKFWSFCNQNRKQCLQTAPYSLPGLRLCTSLGTWVPLTHWTKPPVMKFPGTSAILNTKCSFCWWHLAPHTALSCHCPAACSLCHTPLVYCIVYRRNRATAIITTASRNRRNLWQSIKSLKPGSLRSFGSRLTDCCELWHTSTVLLVWADLEGDRCVNKVVVIFWGVKPGRQKSIATTQQVYEKVANESKWPNALIYLSLIHIWRCRRIERCRSRWSPYH